MVWLFVDSCVVFGGLLLVMLARVYMLFWCDFGNVAAGWFAIAVCGCGFVTSLLIVLLLLLNSVG